MLSGIEFMMDTIPAIKRMASTITPMSGKDLPEFRSRKTLGARGFRTVCLSFA